MHFTRTTDVALVERVLSHPRLFPTLAYWLGPGIFVEIVATHECVQVFAGDEFLGLFLLRARPDEGCTEIHVCLLPNAWGPKGRAAARELSAWFWREHPKSTRVVAVIDAANRLAVHFARRAGMTISRRIERGLFKCGAWRDAIEMTVSRN